MPERKIEWWSVFLYVLVIASPIIVHHTYGKLPLVNYEWFVGNVPKLQRDFQKISDLYDVETAQQFISFVTTVMVLSLLVTVCYFGLCMMQVFRGNFCKKFGKGSRESSGNVDSGSNNARAFILMMSLVAFALVWIIPSRVLPPGSGIIFSIKPGVSGEMYIILFATCYSLGLPLSLTNIVCYGRKERGI